MFELLEHKAFSFFFFLSTKHFLHEQLEVSWFFPPLAKCLHYVLKNVKIVLVITLKYDMHNAMKTELCIILDVSSECVDYTFDTLDYTFQLSKYTWLPMGVNRSDGILHPTITTSQNIYPIGVWKGCET